MASGVMKNMGYPLPPDVQRPSDAELSTMVNNIFNSDVTKNTISAIIPSLTNCTNPTEAIGKVVQSVTSPDTMKVIQESMTTMAQQVAQQGNPQTVPPGTQTTISPQEAHVRAESAVQALAQLQIQSQTPKTT